jgi:TPR repeat protein
MNELYYNKATESGDNFAQYNLDLHYYEIEKDEIKAFEWFEKSANQEQSDAQNYLGYFYENGIGVQKNLEKAYCWYQKSAKNGNKFAQYNLISYYLNRWKIGGELAEQENDKIQYGLGYFYELQKDLEKSFYWYQKSAENGKKFAQYNLGLYYQFGCGIEKNEIEAFKWYEKSAEQNNSDAQNYLGFLYKNGINIQKDLKKSFYWYQKSAENGNKIAQYNLSNFYRYGWEIEKNETKAQEWYKELAGPYNKFFIKNNELIDLYINNNINDNNPFNEIQFNEPIVNANCETNLEFITVKATIFSEILDTSYIEVKKLQKLLISRKDDVDYILNLQPVYAIGIDFQQNSTRPCIACWVAKSLDITVLECLENIFEDQFEVIYKIVIPSDINENNNQSNCYDEEDLEENSNNGNHGNGNGNGNGSGSGSGSGSNGNNNNNNGSNNISNYNDSNDNNNDDGDGDDDGNYGNNSSNKKDKRIYISSKVNAKVINTEFLQDFNISAKLWAKTSPFEDTMTLKYDIDVYACGIGNLLSNQYPLLNKIGFGYLLRSIKVQVSPLPNNGSDLFDLKEISQPTQMNQNLEYSVGDEMSFNGKLGISKTPGVEFTGGYKKNNNTKCLSQEWEFKYKGPYNDGEYWLYERNKNLDKSEKTFAPGVHSGEWFVNEEMHGFCITITQELRCEITRGWRQFLPNTKISLQRFPIMAHNLKVTFNDLNDFNGKLKRLNKTRYKNIANITTTVGSNEMGNRSGPQGILTLNDEEIGEINRSLNSLK